MPSILVTGGAGYIGSHTVVELLNAGYDPIIVDNFSNSEKSVLNRLESITGRKIKCYEYNCNEKGLIESIFKSETALTGCIHFAAFKAVGESMEFPLKYYMNNINSLLVLMSTMLEFNVPNLVFSSSCTVYGQPDQLPVSELSPTKPAESPYGNTKQISEEIIKDSTNANNPLKCASLRYFNPIGAHPSTKIGELPIGIPNNLVPFLTQTAAGIREELVVFGNDYNTPDGTCVRDYIHVIDLAKAHMKALQFLEETDGDVFYDEFNIGTGHGNSILELITTFESVTGEKVNYRIGPRRAGDIEQVWANVDKAKKVLNWKSELTLGNALQDAWNWQKSLEKHGVS